ncbi:MAG: hypothetical protein MJZ34_05075 [Paludibacteraceae bacterium]|nr:hypothetical protein [Paludibacteraceae bacterium]
MRIPTKYDIINEKKEVELDNSFFNIIYEIVKSNYAREAVEWFENIGEEEFNDPKVVKKYDYLKKQIEGCSQPNLKQKGVSYALSKDAKPREGFYMYIEEDFIKTPYTYTAREALDAFVESNERDFHRPNDRTDIEANLEYDKRDSELDFIGGKIERLASAYKNLKEEYEKCQRARNRSDKKRENQERILHTMCKPIQEMEDFGKDVMVDKYIDVMTNMYKREYERYIKDKENGRNAWDYKCRTKVWEEPRFYERMRNEAELYVRQELDRAYFEIGTYAGHSPKLIKVDTDFRQNITALVEQTEDTKYGNVGQKWYVRTILAWGDVNRPHFRTIINKR